MAEKKQEQQEDTEKKQVEETKQQENISGSSGVDNLKDAKENKAITLLSYVGILFLVPLLLRQDSPFAQFHAKQGLILFIGWIVGGFTYLLFGLGVLIHILVIVFSIMGIMNVLNGKKKELPLVSDLVKKFNI
jgi:uncharacterized membrane protein